MPMSFPEHFFDLFRKLGRHRLTKKDYAAGKDEANTPTGYIRRIISVGLSRVEPVLGIRAQLDVRKSAPTSAAQAWDAMVTVYQSAGKRARRAKMVQEEARFAGMTRQMCIPEAVALDCQARNHRPPSTVSSARGK